MKKNIYDSYLTKVMLGATLTLSPLGVVANVPDVGYPSRIAAPAPPSTITVKGTISDSQGPLIGATIKEKGTTNGAVSDIEGNFTIQVSSPNAILVISSIGFVQQEVKVGSQKVINITMKEDNQSLNEVVVVGYGTQKKVNLTGSVAAVNVEK